MKKKLLLLLNLILYALFSSNVHTGEIKIGQIVNQSGEFKKYSYHITTGIQAAFHEINSAGGINGSLVKLVTRNDKGNPIKTVNITKELKKEGVELFLGSMGSRSIKALEKEIAAGSITMLFPWGGADDKDSKPVKNCIYGPGQLQPQTAKIAEFICDEQKIKQIALFHADDSFSTIAMEQFKAKLKKRSVTPTSVQAYSRYTLNFKEACKNLIASNPRVVACLSTSMPTVKMIKKFFSQGLYNTTFIGIDSTFMVNDILAGTGATFYYTAAVPHPKTSSLGIAQEYLKALKDHNPDDFPNVLSFTYYICAKLLLNALQQNTDPKKILTSLENLHNHSVGGFIVDFDAEHRRLFGSTTYLIKD